MKPLLSLLVVLLSPFSPSLIAQDQPPKTPAPTIACDSGLLQVRPGDENVEINCRNFPSQGVLVSVKSVSDQTTGKDIPLLAVVQDGKLKVSVPDTIQPGLYSVSIASLPAGSQAAVVMPDQLNVIGPPAIDAIYALTNYPAEKGFNFEIAGKNFSTIPDGNVIEVVGVRLLSKCSTDHEPNSEETPCSVSVEGQSASKIVVKGFYPRHYYGPLKIKVHVGKFSSDQAAVTFAPFTQQGVALAAAAVFFILGYLLYRLITKGMTSDAVDGVKPSPLTSLFLDRQTNSYSLSKFQVIAWTAVTVYSYVYLFLCRTLIQGDFRFPDVSQNLPQLFFVSAGTTVAATAITANVGSKGAGPPQPSPSDFISTGGLVAGDRFQFFTWTLVGCLGYIYLVIRMNPETANISLPDIPQNFLYLMGVSAAGYLGGKLVRDPGPIIKVLSVAKITPPTGTPTTPPDGTPAAPNTPSGAPAAAGSDQFQKDARSALGNDYKPKDDALKVTFPVLTLNLKGENLDPTAKIQVDDQTLRGDMFWINGMPDPQSHLCSEVNVSLNDATQYIESSTTHTLMLVNTDGQSATMNFPIDPMNIDSISGLPADGAAAKYSVEGKNFVDQTTFEWRNPHDSKDPSTTGPANYKSATELTVNFDAGPAGTGKLTLISPIGLRASANASVPIKPA